MTPLPFLATLGLACCGILAGPSLVFAQQENPLPAPPASAAEPDGGEGFEIYNRGPLHEAFAVPASLEPVEGIVIEREPPEPIDEIPPEQRPEGENVVWVPGYWSYDQDLDDFLWVSGVWRDMPPGRTWVPGSWTQGRQGFRWVPGMWVDESQEALSYLPEPPQSQDHGPSSPRPSDEYFWVPGNWVYVSSDYRWQPGYWAPLQPGYVWVPACYLWTPYGYTYVAGYWDYPLANRGLAYAPVYFHHHHHRGRYQPHVVLDSWGPLMVNLFVRPGARSYYFGDYYDNRYLSGGYYPFAYYGRRGGYDPLYTYYNWRLGDDFGVRLARWQSYYARNPDFRPRRTFREQRQFISRTDNRIAHASTITTELDALTQADEAPVRITRISPQEREAITQTARELRDFSLQRGRRGEAEARPEAEGRAPQLRIPRLRAATRSQAPGDADARLGSEEQADRAPGVRPGSVPPAPSELRDRAATERENRAIPQERRPGREREPERRTPEGRPPQERPDREAPPRIRPESQGTGEPQPSEDPRRPGRGSDRSSRVMSRLPQVELPQEDAFGELPEIRRQPGDVRGPGRGSGNAPGGRTPGSQPPRGQAPRGNAPNRPGANPRAPRGNQPGTNQPRGPNQPRSPRSGAREDTQPWGRPEAAPRGSNRPQTGGRGSQGPQPPRGNPQPRESGSSAPGNSPGNAPQSPPERDD